MYVGLDVNWEFVDLPSCVLKSLFLDINECEASPCKNGGTCDNQPGGYSCNCKKGYTGQNCEQGTDYRVN